MSSLYRNLRWVATLALLMITLPGCGKDSPTEPGGTTVTSSDADDAASLVGMSMARGLIGDPALLGVPGGGVAAPTNAAAETTIVTPFVTWTLSRSFYNAFGLVQPAYDPITTVRMTASARGVGTIRTTTDTVTFGSAASLEVSGLSILQDTLVCDGTRRDTLLASFQSPLHDVHMHRSMLGAMTWSGVRYLEPVNSHPWPLSGTATWTLSVNRLRTSDRTDVERHYDCTVVVVFDGTRNASLTVDRIHRYTLDLLDGHLLRR